MADQTPAQAPPNTGTPPPTNQPKVEFSPEQISQMLGQAKLKPEQLQALGAQLSLSGEEMGRLQAGQAKLAMTPAQYAAFTAKLAEYYAKGAQQGQGQKSDNTSSGGSLCGGGSNPTPTPTQVTHIPAETGTHTNVTETKAGTTDHTGAVGGGTVTLRHGVEGGGMDQAFAISYSGTNAGDSHWLQFIWREVVGINNDGSAHPLPGSISTTGGSYQLTMGGTDTGFGTPAANNFNTDTVGTSAPFYESARAADGAAGTNNRQPNLTAIYDQPYDASDKAGDAFTAGAKRVVSRAHFNTFLIQNDKVVYVVQTNIEWRFNTASDTPARVVTNGASGAATALPAEIKARFDAQWPAYSSLIK